VPVASWAGDVNWNLGLSSWLGRGNQLDVPYDYSENYLTLNLDAESWAARFELEYSDPPEYGFAYTGLRQFWLTHNGDKHTLELGDVGAVFGRGLALNLYEDQIIDFDNIPRGLRLNYLVNDILEFDLLAGFKNEYRFYSPSSALREPDGLNDFMLTGLQATIYGSSFSSSPYIIASELKSDYRWPSIDESSTSVNTEIVRQKMRALQAGLAQSIYGTSWDVFVEYSLQRKGFDYPIIYPEIQLYEDGVGLDYGDNQSSLSGAGIYAQVNWYPEWATVLFEYKRYAYGREEIRYKSDPYYQGTKPLPWQIGPTGIRQHDINLLGNVTHPVDYGDEVGYNLELRKYFGYAWALTLSATAASQIEDEGDFRPCSDARYSPWQEYLAELEYSGSSLTNRFFLARTNATVSGASTAEQYEHLTLVPAYLTWHPSDKLSLSTVLEYQASNLRSEFYDDADAEGDAEEHNYSTTHIIFSADVLHRYSASVIWDRSDDPALATAEGGEEFQNWLSTEISVKPTDKIWLRASYGKEKGGVRCTGGVCRVLNPFEGFRMSLEWRF
jgi:hypothetical protein